MLITIAELRGQENFEVKHRVLLTSEVYKDTLSSTFNVSSVGALVENCVVQSVSLGNKKHQITITPLNSSVQKAKAVFQYTDGFKPYYVVYELTYTSSKITTKTDYILYSGNENLVIDPLSNDSTTSNSLELYGIAHAIGGTATIDDQSIVFTPFDSLDEGSIMYGVRDDLQNSSNGLVQLVRLQPTSSNSEKFYSVLSSRKLDIILRDTGFVLSNTPTKGSISTINDFVFQYVPNISSIGMDTITFTNGQNFTFTAFIKILERLQNHTSVRDDYVYTPKNTPITFNVFDNDLANHFPIVSFSTELTNNGGGSFTYSPPTNFSGVKTFSYTINYGLHQSVGKIYVIVGNYAPKTELKYAVSTLKNFPVALTYDIPLLSHEFNLLNNPEFGIVEILSNSTVNGDCSNFYSQSTIIYNPDQGYYGKDSFDIEYCVDNNPCIVYKIYVEIFDNNDDDLCPCTGSDCVWKGDLNGDGKVSILDVLPLARYLGYSGAEQQNNFLPFESGLNVDDWAMVQPNGKNIKHIDSNGDGIISSDDLQLVDEHYGKVHNLVSHDVLGTKDIIFEINPSTMEVDSGDLLILDLYLGTPNKPVFDLLGIAFELNINPDVIDSSTVKVNYHNNTWFSQNAGLISLTKQPTSGLIETAVGRSTPTVVDELEGIRPVGGSGNGLFADISFTVVDELEGIRSMDDKILQRIYIRNIVGETTYGEQFLIPDTFVDIYLKLKRDEVPVPNDEKLILYPNPTSNGTLLHFNGKNIIKGYKVFSTTGQNMEVQNDINAQSTQIVTTNYPEGIYIINVETSLGTIHKKLIITR